MTVSDTHDPATRCVCARCRAHDNIAVGPYTPEEFTRLFGAVNEPPAVEVPVELAVLQVEVDEALAEYDAAVEAWMQACLAKRETEKAHSRQAESSMLLGGNGGAAPFVFDEAEVRDARQVADRAGERLTAARAAYNAEQRRITHRATAAEYAANLAQQQAEREARHEATRQRAQAKRTRRGLKAIAAKVNRA